MVNVLKEIKAATMLIKPEATMINGVIEYANENKVFGVSGSEAVAAFRRLTSNIQCQPE